MVVVHILLVHAMHPIFIDLNVINTMKLRNYVKVSLQTVNERIFRIATNSHYSGVVSDVRVLVPSFGVQSFVLFLEQTMHRQCTQSFLLIFGSYLFSLKLIRNACRTKFIVGGDEAKDRK